MRSRWKPETVRLISYSGSHPSSVCCSFVQPWSPTIALCLFHFHLLGLQDNWIKYSHHYALELRCEVTKNNRIIKKLNYIIKLQEISCNNLSSSTLFFSWPSWSYSFHNFSVENKNSLCIKKEKKLLIEIRVKRNRELKWNVEKPVFFSIHKICKGLF